MSNPLYTTTNNYDPALNLGYKLPIANLDSTGATNGQVPSYNGTTVVWTTVAGGSGITSLTGDVTATGPGAAAATIAANAVTTAKILDANVTTAKIADNAVDGTKIAITSQATGSIMYYDGTNWIPLAAGTAGQTLTMNGGGTAPVWA